MCKSSLQTKAWNAGATITLLYIKSWTGLIARVDTHNGVVGLTDNPFMGRDSTLSLYRTRSQTKGAGWQLRIWGCYAHTISV